MCLAQGHNAVAPVRLESSDTRSRVKHSTTIVNLNLSILKKSYYIVYEMKKKSSCYSFAITFLSSILAKCVNDKAMDETQKFELRFFEILTNNK